jgi:tripartite-type tricarboxylate transporter receptor subunit TctC
MREVKKMAKFRIRRWLLACAVIALLPTVGKVSPASAQGYPNQTIKIVVPFVAGGGVDVVARLIAPSSVKFSDKR